MIEQHRPSLRLASQARRKSAREPTLSYSAFASHAAMALIVIILLTLTFATSGNISIWRWKPKRSRIKSGQFDVVTPSGTYRHTLNGQPGHTDVGPGWLRL